MNRNVEWEYFVNDIKKSLPPRLEYSAHNAIRRADKRHFAALLLSVPFAGLFIFVILLLTVTGTPSGLAQKLGNLPILRRFAGLETAK